MPASTHRKLLRDIETGNFVATDGGWTSDERKAMELQSPFQIARLGLGGSRNLEIVIKFADGSPDRAFPLGAQWLTPAPRRSDRLGR